MQVLNVKQALARHAEGTFVKLIEFNHNHFSACDITGESPVWEMHPDTDEFFYIIEGQFEITLLDGETPTNHIATAGSSFVVPKGVWHKPSAPNGCQFIFFTPGESLHSEAEDPRV